MKLIFVHDGIYNSVADYYFSRVGVGCLMYVECMSVGLFFSFFYDGITFERFKLEG